jgi:triacylglycerol lipase
MKAKMRNATVFLIFTLCGFSQASHACWLFCSNSDYAKTRYPIVLVHGMSGYDAINGVNHFYQIPEDLRANGAQVFVAQVSAFNSAEVRGEQLLQQVHEYLAISGAEKVNLIGQSHGSPTVRYVAGVAPELVASVTSIGGPVKGTPLADSVADLRDAPVLGDIAEPILATLINAIGAVVTVISDGDGLPQDAIAVLDSTTTEGAARFNLRFPDGVPATECGEGDAISHGVRYYSWSGGGVVTNALDPLDLVSALVAPLLFGNEPSDSLIGTCSSHLGKVIRDNYRMNHFDEINQTMGLVSLWETNPKAVHRQHANRLKRAGL